MSARQEYVRAKEREPKWKNTGEPPVTGLLEKGKPARKELCEDIKINDPESGLFVVADGVSTASGWFASRAAGEVVNLYLGRRLDEEVENIRRSDKQDEARKTNLISQLIRAQIQHAVVEADQKIAARSMMDPTMGDCATTLSLAKVVQMPDDSQDLFYTNVGDSRIYLMRGHQLHRLTEDDGWVKEGLRIGALTKEQATRIDQASSLDELSEPEQVYFKHRRMVSRAVGVLKNNDQTMDIKHLRLQEGDRLVVVSDGLTDQMREIEVRQRLMLLQDDRAAERDLQQGALDISLDGTSARAKGDDISVIVKTIRREKTVVESPAQPENVVERAFSRKDVEAWRKRIPQVEKQLQEKLRSLQVDPQEISALRKEIAQLEYWVGKMDLKEIAVLTPPRFKKGDRVRVVRKDLNPPGPDRDLWNVMDYDVRMDQYLVSHPSGAKHQIIERFELELTQPGDLVRPGDQIVLRASESKDQVIYTVVEQEQEKGEVVLIREIPEGMERRREPSDKIEQALRFQLNRARGAKKQMEAARRILLDKTN